MSDPAPPSPPFPAAAEGVLQVWRIPLEAPESALRQAGALLDAGERNRAGQFADDTLRRRYVLRHAARRQLVGAAAGVDPAALVLEAGAWGKPVLRPPPGAAARSVPEFNDTDSGDLALVAVGNLGELGIDVEAHAALEGDLWESRTWFAREEREFLERLDPGLRTAAFHDCWTRKEALLKALGTGLSLAPDLVPVPLGPLPATGTPVARPGGGSPLHLFDLTPHLPAGYSAALAVAHAPVRVTWHEWSWSWS